MGQLLLTSDISNRIVCFQFENWQQNQPEIFGKISVLFKYIYAILLLTDKFYFKKILRFFLNPAIHQYDVVV